MQIPKLLLSLLALTSGLFLTTGLAHSRLVNTGQPQPVQTVVSAPPAAPAQSLDRMIDTKAIAYLEIKDVKSQLEGVRLIDMFKGFMPLMVKSNPAERKAALDTLWTIMAPSLQGTQLVVALWPDDAGPAASSKKKSREPLFGFFMKFASSDQLRQLMQRQSEIERALKTLMGEKSDKPTSDVSVVTLDDMLVVGDPTVVNRVVQVRFPATSLVDDVDYQAARARLAAAPIFLYGDLTGLAKLADGNKKKGGTSEGEEKDLDEDDKQLDAVKEIIDLEHLPKVAVGVQIQETQTVIKGLVLDRHSGSTSKGFFSWFRPAESSLRSAQWLPSSADLAVTLAPDWQALYDAIVPPLEKMFASKEGGGSPIPMMEAVIGYKLRDQLLPALGSISVSLDSLDMLVSAVSGSPERPADPPKLSVLVGLRNREVVEGAIKNVTRMMSAGAGASATTIQENGATITKLGDGGYAIVEDVLIFSPALDALRKNIQGRQSARNLAADVDFVRAMQGLPPDLIVWGYVSPSAIKQVFESLRQEAITEEPQLAGVLAPFPIPAQSASLGSWREDADLISEARLPNGMLPVLIASGIASDRAAERDRAISEKAMAALGKPEFSGVALYTKNKVVTLTGTVKTEAAKSRAQKLVEKIEGVKSVVNEIEVEPEEEN